MKKSFFYITIIASLITLLSSCDTTPYASFTISNETVAVGETVSINNNSNGYHYLWEFGDGEESIDSYPADYTYNKEGNYTITLTAFSKNGKNKSIAIQTLVVEATSANNIEDFEGGSTFTWLYYNDGEQWDIGSSEVYEGSYASYSRAISNNDRATKLIEDTYNAGTISFYSKVSSEYNYDFLKFYIDGDLKGSWSGTTGGWEFHTYNVSAGTHTFLWEYEKDEVDYDYTGDDRAYIDYITFPITSNKKIKNKKIRVGCNKEQNNIY